MKPGEASTTKPSVTWQAPEYVPHAHTAAWYGLLILGTVALGGLVYLLTKDIFGVIIIELLGAIVAIAAMHRPKTVTYEISGSTLTIGAKPYQLGLYRSFSLADEGELGSATLLPIKRFMPPLGIYFTHEEVDKVADALADHLPHDDRLPDRVDRLARRLHF